MERKVLFLEIKDVPGKPPIVYIWTHHGRGALSEWRGEIVRPRGAIRRALQSIIDRYHGKHSRAYTRARARGGRRTIRGEPIRQKIDKLFRSYESEVNNERPNPD